MATSILLGLDLSDEQATAFTDLFGVWLRGFMGLPFDLPFTTFGRAMQARRQLLAMVEEVVLRRRVRDSQRDPAEAAAASRDILSILLHDMRSGTEETLSLDELKDQVLLQLFAGHDTTSAALTSLAFVIARYPDVRRRLQEEVAAAFPDPAQPIPAEALRCARPTAMSQLSSFCSTLMCACACACAIVCAVVRVRCLQWRVPECGNQGGAACVHASRRRLPRPVGGRGVPEPVVLSQGVEDQVTPTRCSRLRDLCCSHLTTTSGTVWHS
jgi:hypothetical protein